MPTGRLDSGLTAKQVQVERRRRQVANLLVRRFTRTEIAEALGHPVSTIDKDIAAVRDTFEKELGKTSSVMQVAADVLQRSHARERELWAVVQRSMGRKEQGKPVEEEDRVSLIMALRELRANQNDELRSLQSLGLIYKAPQRMSLDMRVMSQLSALPEETLKELAEADEASFARLVEQTLGTIGTEALGKPLLLEPRHDEAMAEVVEEDTEDNGAIT